MFKMSRVKQNIKMETAQNILGTVLIIFIQTILEKNDNILFFIIIEK